MSPVSLRTALIPVSLSRWLAVKSPVERAIVGGLFVAVAAALLWIVLWQPLVSHTASLRQARAANAATLALARDRVKEIVELARTSAKAEPIDSRADLDRILAQQNLRSLATSAEWRDARAHLVFAGIGYDSLLNLIEALQRDARLRVVEATITARVDPGTVRAELTFAR